MNVTMNNGNITIDGRKFSGNNVSIRNGKVIVDGVTQEGELTGPVTVTIEGDVQSLENHSGDVFATNVGTISTGSGDIQCGNVNGSITTDSGDVECGAVAGNIKTGSGDIVHR